MRRLHLFLTISLVTLFSLLLLSNCSGGGSGSDAESSTYTVGGSVWGLSSDGLVLQNNGADDLPVGGNSFEFPTALPNGSTYDVTVLTQPTGQDCDATHGSGTISGSNVTDVAITCRGWGSPTLIESDNAGGAWGPQIATDPNGNALAVWYQSDGTRKNILANRYTAGSGWGSTTLIESDVGDAEQPQIAIDPNGNALAVWFQGDNILANRYTVGSGWGSATLIENDAGGALYPQIAIDPDGNGMAVWNQWDVSQHDVWSNRYTMGSGWGSATLIEGNAGGTWYPQIATDPNGNALSVWRQFDGTRYNIWVNRYTAGSGWGSATLIESGAGDAGFQQIAIDPNGNALAVWYQHDGTRYNIWANRYTAGSGWGSATLIESDNAGDAAVPQIAIDPNGNALAVWQQSDGTRYNIWANRYTAGSGWGSATLIESDNAGDASVPQIAIDPNGNALAVWYQSDGTRKNIWANRYTAGSGWGSTTLIESDVGDAEQPQIAIDPNGNALAVWYQHDGTRYNIWANRYE